MAEAATKVQISHRTLVRWLTQPEFQAAYREAQQGLLNDAMNVLRRASTGFARTVEQVANDAALPPATRLAAAARGLEMVLKVHGQAEIERRLTELEEIVMRLEEQHEYRR